MYGQRGMVWTTFNVREKNRCRGRLEDDSMGLPLRRTIPAPPFTYQPETRIHLRTESWQVYITTGAYYAIRDAGDWTPKRKTDTSVLVSRRETLESSRLARDLRIATPARHGRPCCGEERSGKVTRSGLQPWGVAYNGGHKYQSGKTGFETFCVAREDGSACRSIYGTLEYSW